MRELLTHSRMDSFKSCRKKHYFAYELGLRRIEEKTEYRSASHPGRRPAARETQQRERARRVPCRSPAWWLTPRRRLVVAGSNREP